MINIVDNQDYAQNFMDSISIVGGEIM